MHARSSLPSLPPWVHDEIGRYGRLTMRTRKQESSCSIPPFLDIPTRERPDYRPRNTLKCYRLTTLSELDVSPAWCCLARSTKVRDYTRSGFPQMFRHPGTPDSPSGVSYAGIPRFPSHWMISEAPAMTPCSSGSCRRFRARLPDAGAVSSCQTAAPGLAQPNP